MATAEGRAKLGLTALPENAEIVQCLKFGADDASCLNLNKVTSPGVLGVDMDALAASGFVADFARIKNRDGNAYPALIDATVLTWSLGMNLGDTLHYKSSDGRDVALCLTATLPNTIFQGNVVIDRRHFAEIWPEITGSEVALLKVDDDEKPAVQNLLSQALSEYGVRVMATGDRLRQFNSVTDTYLTIFLTLGSLGLLLGIVGFMIVVGKNLTVRRRDIELFSALGYSRGKTAKLLYRENVIVPLYAVLTGVLCSLAGILPSMAYISLWMWLTTLLFTALCIAGVLVFVRKSVRRELRRIKI
jgi:putative ABC transport system permease protein